MSPSAFTWVPPHSSVEWRPASSTRTMSPYFSPKNAMAPRAAASALVVSKWRTGALSRISSLARSSMAWICSGVTGSKWLKSKRSRSGATSEPCCFTWSPSTWRSAQWRRWVPVWLRRMASRRSASMVAVASWPASIVPSTTCARCRCSPGQRVGGVEHLGRAGRGGDGAGVADLAAGLGVEGGAVEEDADLVGALRARDDGQHRGLRLVLVTAGERGGAVLGEDRGVLRRSGRPRSPRPSCPTRGRGVAARPSPSSNAAVSTW